MILVLDLGNSRVKWGRWADGRWHAKGRLPLERLERLSEVLAEHPPERIGISCVAAERYRRRLEALLADWPGAPFWLHAEARWGGLDNRYANPQQLGVDRYAMLLACLHLGLAPCVVVGVGTAVTVDALQAPGAFLGGMILPGVQLMRASLQTGTAGVGEVHGQVREFPGSTADAVETGIWSALAGAVEAMRARLSALSGVPVGVVLSGGDGNALAKHVAEPSRVIDDLVLEGILWSMRA